MFSKLIVNFHPQESMELATKKMLTTLLQVGYISIHDLHLHTDRTTTPRMCIILLSAIILQLSEEFQNPSIHPITYIVCWYKTVYQVEPVV